MLLLLYIDFANAKHTTVNIRFSASGLRNIHQINILKIKMFNM